MVASTATAGAVRSDGLMGMVLRIGLAAFVLFHVYTSVFGT